jgi:cathepsin F
MTWANKHQKVYSNISELVSRFQIYRDNLSKLQTIHSLGESEKNTMGVTQFFDLTAQEFSEQYLNLKITHMDKLKAKSSTNTLVARDEPVPESFDWREQGAVTSVKNQGSCGSCWAFSAIGNIEGQLQIKTGKAVDLSEQQLVDCDKVDQGCSGGLMEDAYKYLMQAGGVDSNESYPYNGRGNTCNYKPTASAAQVSGYNFAGTQDEEQIKAILHQTGPLAIAMNATPLQFYFGGIYTPWFSWTCSPSSINHGILLVGYGVEKSKPYWIVKNSWGSGWGEKGFFRIVRGKGACGVNTYVISATLQ